MGGYSISSASPDKAEGTIGGLVTAEDFWIVKLDSAGNIIWQNTIGGNGDDFLTSLELTSDGGYILGGYPTQEFQAIRQRRILLEETMDMIIGLSK